MLVTREDAAGVTTLTLNRPEKLNAITPALMVDLRGQLDQIAGDESVRCVILTGAGRSFCSGHDLSAIASAEHALAAARTCDGVIIGSALIKIARSSASNDEAVDDVGRFLRGVRDALDGE